MSLMTVGELRFEQDLWILMVESSCGHNWMLFYPKDHKPGENEIQVQLEHAKLTPCKACTK
jgi:hypothetical protein